MSSPDADARGNDTPAAGTPSFQMRGKLFTAVTLMPEGGVPNEAFYAALDEQLQKTPAFFNNAPVILDLGAAPTLGRVDDLRRIVTMLKDRQLSAFGVQNGRPAQVAAAREAGLIHVTTGNDAPLRQPRAEKKAERKDGTRTVEAPPKPGKIITSPVRSGQTIIADKGDLVVVAPVSSGAELVAAGNIHIYGRMRGRAMAGAYGDENARIFCQSLEAELLAVAGLYRTSDSLEDALLGKAVQAFLKDDRLAIEALA
ncbi:septum site-determining protein MinC [Acidimangrovimonas sediminis]|uniref:septum site-determining protein MinC n=1 Tax=Acidimangrovimonas sediminis TaxID=2056283 RepID=UPI000C805F41|nr:septum site-determining protein MinC [Acidimangrovimonas sediminis]